MKEEVHAKVEETKSKILCALRRKLDRTFEGLISKQDLERIWKESCEAEPRIEFLYEHAEEAAMTLFGNQWEDESEQDEEEISVEDEVGGGGCSAEEDSR